jgi:hypothetical protein
VFVVFDPDDSVDNPCEIRLFQEVSRHSFKPALVHLNTRLIILTSLLLPYDQFVNLDAYREHESNPFNQEMVNGLADYLEEDMVFIEGEEFAL